MVIDSTYNKRGIISQGIIIKIDIIIIC